jgi:hypothetical protein
MTNTLSRILAAIELAALLIPASGRALLGAVLVWVDPFGKSVFPLDLFVILLVAIAAMAGLWRILTAFIFKGADCFEDILSVWWWLAITGAVMVVAALPLNLSYRLQFALPDSPLTDFIFYLSAVGYCRDLSIDAICARFDRALATNTPRQPYRGDGGGIKCQVFPSDQRVKP